MFKRTAALLLVGAALTACSGDDSGGTAATTTAVTAAVESSTTVASWVEQAAQDVQTRRETIDGHLVLVDEEGQMVYVEDCATARTITAEGGPYGPANGQAGYAYICNG